MDCHSFGRYRAISVQAMDLTIMTQRLREDWFRRYLRDSQAYRPNTRMTSYWPLTGPSHLTTVFDGDSDKQIQAIWEYLTGGTQAKTPEGLGDLFLELIPTKEAIIYRASIEGAGPHAIGVGFPEGIHIAFDAGDNRLAMLWRGGGIDAGSHWRGDGEGFDQPLGEDLTNLVTGVPIAILSSPTAPWPEGNGKKMGVRFKGYKLTKDKRPTFMYTFGNLKIEDTPNPQVTGDSVELIRQITFTGPSVQNLWSRAARSENIDEQDGWYVFDGLKMRIANYDETAPVIRQQGQDQEILIPVSSSAVITQRFRW